MQSLLGKRISLIGHYDPTDFPHRLQEETSRVEDHLLENQTFTTAIIASFTNSKSNSFENLLEPLQKLLRLSPPVAASMARSPELFDCIGQKLNHNKPAIRLNLLRIIGSLCDATDEGGFLLERFGLYDAILELQVSDSAVLVRSMAQELIRSCEENDNISIHSGHGGSGGQNAGRRKHPGGAVRRASASTTPPHLLERQMSMPTSPQLGRSERASIGFFDAPERVVSQTPRRQRNGVGYINGSVAVRPGSKDGPSMVRDGSPAFILPSINRSNTGSSGGSDVAIAKSRLPRTATAYRSSRQPPRMDSSVGLGQMTSGSSTPALSGTPAHLRTRESQYFDRKHAADVTVASNARRTTARRTPGGDGKWS
jgi:hypothetical protein